MITLVIAILELLGKVIPPLAKWLAGRASGYNAWKSEIAYWAGRPRPLDRRFLGRGAELKAISNAFQRGDSVALSGGTGTGKSQLAAEFAHRSKRKGFWTPGGETTDQTLMALALHLGIQRQDRSDDEILFQTRQRLQGLPSKTLWVIDNLPDLDQLNSLLNDAGKASLLVTSQDSREGFVLQGVDFQPVGVLDPGPAVQLLCRVRHHDPKQPVFLEIVEEAGRLPRAVEALAVQLESPGETPERLLEELRSTPSPLELDRFKNQTGGLQIPRTDSLFNALRGPLDALPVDIREALAPLGYTADLPIPMPLAEALTGLAGGTLISFVDECSSKSVLSADKNQITLHSLTAAVIAATNPDGSLQTALRRAGDRLGQLAETGYPIPVAEMHQYQRMLSWEPLMSNQEDQALLAFNNNLAIAYDSAGRFDEAANLNKQNLEVRERILGPEHHDTLASRNNLANAYQSAGRFDEAANLNKQNLEVREQVLGSEHPDTLTSRNNLAAAYRSAGRFDEAVGLTEQNTEVMERVLGPEHPDTIGSLNNLASAYDSAGRYEEAASLNEHTLEVMERILGPEHPDTLQGRNNLAINYDTGGRHEVASRLHEQNLEVRQRVLGPEHPDTFQSRNNLATAYQSAGHFDKATGLYQENLQVMQRVMGPEHPDTLANRNNLANSIRNAGRFNEAVEMHEQNLEVMQRVLGPEHPDTLGCRNNLANAYGSAGRFDEAAGVHRENLEVQQRVLGPEHPDTLLSRNNLATAYRALGRLGDADALFGQD